MGIFRISDWLVHKSSDHFNINFNITEWKSPLLSRISAGYSGLTVCCIFSSRVSECFHKKDLVWPSSPSNSPSLLLRILTKTWRPTPSLAAPRHDRSACWPGSWAWSRPPPGPRSAPARRGRSPGRPRVPLGGGTWRGWRPETRRDWIEIVRWLINPLWRYLLKIPQFIPRDSNQYQNSEYLCFLTFNSFRDVEPCVIWISYQSNV